MLIKFKFYLQIYLSQYGYLSANARNPTSGGNLLSQDSWENAIREFQGFAGLNVTGISHYFIFTNIL
jgi:Putative peptidoglycan binding domain